MRGKINNCVWVCEENAVVLVVLFFLVLRCSSVDAWLLALYTRPKCQLKVESFPTTNGGMPNGSSVGTQARCTQVFASLAPICMLRRCFLTKFLHRSSAGSLLRARALLVGYQNSRTDKHAHSLVYFTLQPLTTYFTAGNFTAIVGLHKNVEISGIFTNIGVDLY